MEATGALRRAIQRVNPVSCAARALGAVVLLQAPALASEPDPAVQALVEAELLSAPPSVVFALEPLTGRVLALAGQADPSSDHPIGGMARPLVLLAALEEGILTLATPEQASWWPSEQTHPLPLRVASKLSSSSSTWTLSLALRAPDAVERVGAEVGLWRGDHLAMATGTLPVTLLSLTHAYAEIARSAAGTGLVDSGASYSVLWEMKEHEGLRVHTSATGFAMGVAPELVLGVWVDGDHALVKQVFTHVAEVVLDARAVTAFPSPLGITLEQAADGRLVPVPLGP